MKKVFLLAALIFPMLIISSNCYAVKIFGVEITYKRGTKEWNGDHTSTECVGRGLCELTIKGGIEAMSFSGQLGSIDGKLVLSIPETYYEKYPEDFEGNIFSVNGEIVVPAEEAAKIKLNGEIVVRPGKYKVVQDDETGNYFVYLTK